MKKHLILPILLSLAFIVVFDSCKSDKNSLPDLSEVEINTTIIRYELELLENLPYTPEIFAKLGNKHPIFTDIFFNNVLPINGGIGSDTFCNNLNNFLKDSLIVALYNKVDTEFSDFNSLESNIKQALKTYKYYFPSAKTPDIYTFISEYSYQKFIFQDQFSDGIGLGLDMFLGANYPYKRLDPDNPTFSQYITRRFSKEYIPLKIIQTILEDKIGPPNGERLLDKMINNGKKIYIAKKILPTTPDSIIFEYTAEQINWCNDNELEMWAFFFDKNLFYETSGVKINKFIDESPNSPGMPSDAPGRTGNYLGYKIVEAYMDRNDEMSLSELILMNDAQKLLEMSRYKPKKE
jgi:hypothetical protein